jgi:hypothetical protein
LHKTKSTPIFQSVCAESRLDMSVPTSSIPFMESEHGRLRRAQRGIDKKDLQRAIKYGDRVGAHPRPNGDQTAKYTYRNITYIVNEVTGQEITAYAKPLELDCVPISRQMEIDHEEAEKQLQEDLNCWTSNCVMVVDTSGSMRESDMWVSLVTPLSSIVSIP